ncbi:hypothetical protein [Turicibacter sanguinis]|uniref:hypothetical protein n=1 Tax=Turicibacter sanguinis TaxID=154288 RepID=UPI0039959AE7
METVLVSGGGERILQSDIDKAVEAVLSVIKKELHDEVLSVETIELVLNECKETIRYKKICL